MNTLRAEARRLARENIPPEIEAVLASVAKYGEIAYWKLRALYNSTTDAEKPAKLEGLRELGRKIQVGEVIPG